MNLFPLTHFLRFLCIQVRERLNRKFKFKHSNPNFLKTIWHRASNMLNIFLMVLFLFFFKIYDQLNTNIYIDSSQLYFLMMLHPLTTGMKIMC